MDGVRADRGGAHKVAGNEEKAMTARKILILAAGPIVAVLFAALTSLAPSPAQGPSNFNEYQVKTSGTLNDDPKADV